ALETIEPLGSRRAVTRVRSQKDRRLDVLEQALEPLAPLAEWLRAQVRVALREDVERHVPGRRGLAEHPHTRVGGMDALLEGAEIEAVVADHDELAVKNDLFRAQLSERRQDLRKVARHRAR